MRRKDGPESIRVRPHVRLSGAIAIGILIARSARWLNV
jgi:hypothetical protein